MNDLLKNIFKEINNNGGNVFIVGGFVRDKLIGKENKDIDLEIFNLSLEQLRNILSKFGKVTLIGKKFGVLNLSGLDVDFCLPRKEICIGKGHKDFNIQIDPFCSTKSAAKRRDLTINSIMQNAITGEVIDHFNGYNDIKDRIIRCVDKNTFKDDPLRVLRIAQFKARFEFEVENETKELCKQMVKEGLLDNLPKERIFEELNKLLLKSDKPSIGFEFLKEINYLPKELTDLIDCNQRKDMHPEGDVWNHTMLVLDNAAKVRNESNNPLCFMLSALCHDIGKPNTTDCSSHSYGHEKEGKKIAFNFLSTITDNKHILENVCLLVENHMKLIQFFNQSVKNNNIIKLQLLFENTDITINDLLLLSKCDFEGKKPLNNNFDSINNWFQNKLKEIGNKPPKSLVTGKDLINLGLKPNPKFKIILNDLFDLQIKYNLNREKLLKILKQII